MELTDAGPCAAEPVTEYESEQLDAAWLTLVGEAQQQGAVPIAPEADSLARGLFALGWAMCARFGTAPPALAGVPVPATEVSYWLSKLSEGFGGGAPVVGQRVSYHGSLTECHGEYWVVSVEQSTDDLSGGSSWCRYGLASWEEGGYTLPKISRVRRASLTPLPEFRRVHRF
ncbi:hypothetical protein AB0G73_24400 [Streptomyces sp. NPDC020719]|uniref:hypothetical protein n=1 Tax=Streptomyces sp. NPDC020719 TaxID=3154896 RepID=UPI0033E37F35